MLCFGRRNRSDDKRQFLSKEKLDKISKRRCKKMGVISSITPPYSSMVSKIRTVYNQGRTNSCTANAICQAFNILNTTDTSFNPSRLYIYARERYLESGMRVNSPMTDTGANECDGLYWATTIGICSDKLWPFNQSKVDVQPPQSYDRDACRHRIFDVFEVPRDIRSIRTILHSGYPILAAIAVYDSFMSEEVANTGIVPMPEGEFIGGHEVVVVGYDDVNERVIVVNSWGKEWGCKPEGAQTRGYFYLPYQYILGSSCYALFSFDKIINV